MSDNPLRDGAEPDSTIGLVSDVLAFLEEQAENAANLRLAAGQNTALLSHRGAAGQAVLLGMLRQTLDQAARDIRHN